MGREAAVYVATPDGSWALAEYTPAGGMYETRQDGPRALWAEIAKAWNEWVTHGSPGRDLLGVTVDEEGTHLWVGNPMAKLGLVQCGRRCRRLFGSS